MKCSLVPPEHIDECWEEVKPFLESASEYTYGRYTVEDIYDCLKEYDHQLWIAFNELGIKAAVVTYFIHYPRKKYLVMSFCGGEQMDQWIAPMLKLLQHWAFDSGCDGIEATARPGWAKIFKNDGHKALWHTFQLPAADAGLGVQNG
jgi:hypothetical protein